MDDLAERFADVLEEMIRKGKTAWDDFSDIAKERELDLEEALSWLETINNDIQE